MELKGKMMRKIHKAIRVTMIENLVTMHKRKSLTQATMVDKIATELACILQESGIEKKDAQVVATVLRGKIIKDDWEE